MKLTIGRSAAYWNVFCVAALGIDALKGVRSRRMNEATAAEDTIYGTLVAPNLVALRR